MKNIKYTLILLCMLIAGAISAQEKDTLSNLAPDAERTIYRYTAASQWGFYTGHNHNFREEFAEKYYIDGSRTLFGMVSEHTGTVSNPDNPSEFKAYSVREDRMPGEELAEKNVPYGQLDLSGKPMVTMFSAPVTVTDSFFVSFNLTDYAHGGFEGDTVGLLCGIQGSRADEDLANIGRNVIRRHNHGDPEWKDFYYQNFTPVKTHFALFPILNSVVGINELHSDEFKIANIYPNPFAEKITLEIQNTAVKELNVSFYNVSGELLLTKKLEALSGSTVDINCEQLPKGNYIVFVKGISSGMAIQMLKQ